MKQLFISLVVLNLCYLLFQQATAEDVIPDMPRERPANLMPSKVSATEPAIDTVLLPEPVPESVAQVVLKTDRDDAESQDAAKNASNLAAKELLATAVKNDDRTAATRSGDESGPSDASSSSCVIAGPFRAQQDAQALVAQLADSGIEATLQPRDTTVLPDYMVYVGPEGSVTEARALEAKFKARQMDSHLIAAGNLQNALSLGVFSRGPLAKSLRQQLESEGYKASISELTRNRRGYQVRTRLPQLIRAKLVEADTPMIDCP